MRPSDATFLSHLFKTPMYVDVGVWNDTSITHDQMTEYERMNGWPFEYKYGNGEEPPPPKAGANHIDAEGEFVGSRSFEAPVDSETCVGIMYAAINPLARWMPIKSIPCTFSLPCSMICR